MSAKVRSLLCAAFIPCAERNSNVSGPSETLICRLPYSIALSYYGSRFVQAILRSFPYSERHDGRKNCRKAARKDRARNGWEFGNRICNSEAVHRRRRIRVYHGPPSDGTRSRGDNIRNSSEECTSGRIETRRPR